VLGEHIHCVAFVELLSFSGVDKPHLRWLLCRSENNNGILFAYRYSSISSKTTNGTSWSRKGRRQIFQTRGHQCTTIIISKVKRICNAHVFRVVHRMRIVIARITVSCKFAPNRFSPTFVRRYSSERAPVQFKSVAWCKEGRCHTFREPILLQSNTKRVLQKKKKNQFN
jgi:hypothetical protein